MTRKTIVLAVATVILVLGLDGCGSADTVTAPSVAAAAAAIAAVDADVAVTVANAVMTDLDDFAASDVFGGIAFDRSVSVARLGDSPPPTTTPPSSTTPTAPLPTSGSGDDGRDKPAGALPTVPNGTAPCQLDSSKGELRCGFGNSNEASSSTIAFVDNKGVKTDGFRPGITDTVRTTLTASRKVTSSDGSFTGTFYRNSARAVGGFMDRQGTRTTNGAGTGADTSSFVNGTKSRKYAGVSADTIRALVYAEQRSANPYPKSGTMIHFIRSTATETNGDGKLTNTEITRRVVVTYDGSATAKIQVGTTTCQLHLDKRTVDNCI